MSLETVDFAIVREAAQKLNPGLAHPGAEQLVRANFQFIFFNKLNAGSFLATPAPQEIVDQIAEIFHRRNQIQDLIEEGKVLAKRFDKRWRKRQLIGEIDRAARSLESVFRRYFIDLRQSSYTLNMRIFDTDERQFGYYIFVCEQIHQSLSQELENYFLNAEPGVIEVTDYELVGITVLSESLRKVSMITQEKLRR